MTSARQVNALRARVAALRKQAAARRVRRHPFPGLAYLEDVVGCLAWLGWCLTYPERYDQQTYFAWHSARIKLRLGIEGLADESDETNGRGRIAFGKAYRYLADRLTPATLEAAAAERASLERKSHAEAAARLRESGVMQLPWSLETCARVDAACQRYLASNTPDAERDRERERNEPLARLPIACLMHEFPTELLAP